MSVFGPISGCCVASSCPAALPPRRGMIGRFLVCFIIPGSPTDCQLVFREYSPSSGFRAIARGRCSSRSRRIGVNDEPARGPAPGRGGRHGAAGGRRGPVRRSRGPAGQEFVKAERNRALQEQLDGRNRTAIEYKHQNISAVLLAMERPYLNGYVPARNYQKRLPPQAVAAYLDAPPRDPRAAGVVARPQPDGCAVGRGPGGPVFRRSARPDEPYLGDRWVKTHPKPSTARRRPIPARRASEGLSRWSTRTYGDPRWRVGLV